MVAFKIFELLLKNTYIFTKFDILIIHKYKNHL